MHGPTIQTAKGYVFLSEPCAHAPARRQIAEGILKSSGISGYQLGTSKVFLRAGQMAMLDKQRTEKLSKAATVMQRHARGWLARLHYKRDLLAVVRMQVRAAACVGQHVWDRRVVLECISALACGMTACLRYHMATRHSMPHAALRNVRCLKGTLRCMRHLAS